MADATLPLHVANRNLEGNVFAVQRSTGKSSQCQYHPPFIPSFLPPLSASSSRFVQQLGKYL